VVDAYLSKFPDIRSNSPPPPESEKQRYTLCARGLALVEDLFSEERIWDMLRDYQSRYRAMPSKEQKSLIKPTHEGALHQSLDDFNANYNLWNSILQVSPLSTLPPECHSFEDSHFRVQISILRVFQAARAIPLVTATALKYDILTAYLQRERARSYIVIHKFITHDLSTILQIIFHQNSTSCLHLSSPSSLDDGSPSENFLSGIAPSFSPLVTLILDHLRSCRVRYKSKTRKNNDHIVSESDAKCNIPVDCLIPILGKEAAEGIPEVDRVLAVPAAWKTKNIYSAVQECFQDTLVKIFILPYIRESADSSAPSTKQGKLSMLDRFLMRGAIIRRIVDAAGTDAICCSRDMAKLLDDPSQLWAGNKAREERLWPALRKEEEKVLQPLEDCLEVLAKPGVGYVAETLANFIDHRCIEFQRGRSITDLEFYVGITSTSKKAPAAHQRAAQNVALPTLATLLIRPSSPLQFTVLALILRDALNFQQHWKPANEAIRNVLCGRDPMNGRTTSQFYNADHWNPIRHLSFSTNAFLCKIPPHLLTTPRGLSNVLTFMGTGQGYRTRNFLKLSDSTGGTADSFFCTSSEDCCQLFQRAVDKNIQLAESSGWSGEEIAEMLKKEGNSKLPGYIQMSDCQSYGTPNNILSLRPATRSKSYHQMSIEEKLTPYWTAEITSAWVEFLGPLLNQDPQRYNGAFPTWSATLNLFQNVLHVSGFQSGLTSLQATNNICFSSGCSAPTLDEMAAFIQAHRSLGAWNGLCDLGFKPYNCKAIQVALSIVYDHLNRNLSQGDKRILGLDKYTWIFMEHVLCKVRRYGGRLQWMNKWVEEAEKSGHWMSNRMEGDFEAFPIPFQASLERVKELLDTIQ
jgi:hypothetical protein